MSDTPPQCYVCLEACIGEHSPCVCGAPVHHQCFVTMDNLNTCTICREPYIFQPCHLVEKPQEKPPSVVVRRDKYTAAHPISVLLFYSVIWYVMGVAGKLVWLFSGGKLQHHVLAFWNVEHIVAFLGACMPFIAVGIFRQSRHVRARVAVTNNRRPVYQTPQTIIV